MLIAGFTGAGAAGASLPSSQLSPRRNSTLAERAAFLFVSFAAIGNANRESDGFSTYSTRPSKRSAKLFVRFQR
jgi:hypothetical protein